nr:FkbM family methyltransferase [Limobrevibacterium gyesilva]
MPFPLLYEVFYQSARALGVRSYEVRGENGSFFGPLYDQTVIKTYLRRGSWSPNIAGLLDAFFETCERGAFYDIGANIGLVTASVSRHRQVRCVAFEPDPGNFRLLRANVAASATGDTVELINAAVAGEAGQLRFTRSGYNSGDHRLSPEGEIVVQTVRLDDYPPPPGRFAVKIDTQGAEPAIFAGGGRTLGAADLIICEFWPWGMRRMGLSPDPILAFIRSTGRHGHVLRHGEPAGAPLDMAALEAALMAVVRDGGEHAAVDLVLLGPQDMPAG